MSGAHLGNVIGHGILQIGFEDSEDLFMNRSDGLVNGSMWQVDCMAIWIIQSG